MSKSAQPVRRVSTDAIYSDDIEGKIEETLAILKEIDRVYGNRREAIRKQVSSTPRRKRPAEVDLLDRRDSELHVLRLAELQYCRMRASWLDCTDCHHSTMLLSLAPLESP
jgi:hypothetical protein